MPDGCLLGHWPLGLVPLPYIAGHGNKLSDSSVLQNDQINTNIYIIHEYTCIYIFIVVQKKLGIPRNTKASL
jgi:hypothetical protein